MNHKSKIKFKKAVDKAGLHRATNRTIPGELHARERHQSMGHSTVALSLDSLTPRQLYGAKKIL